MEQFIISKENFNGLICIWGRDQDSPTTMNSLMCHVYNNDSLFQNKVNLYYTFFKQINNPRYLSCIFYFNASIDHRN